MTDLSQLALDVLEAEYLASAHTHGRATRDGDSRTGNHAYDRLAIIIPELRRRGANGEEVLLRLCDDVDPAVRVWSATALLFFAPIEALRVLKVTAGGPPSPERLNAAMTLREWRLGAFATFGALELRLRITLSRILPMFDWILDRFWRWRRGREQDSQKPWERAVRSMGLYPAYSDWVGGFALDSDGEIWFSDEPAVWKDPQRVAEPNIRFAVLGVAVLRYRELAHLAPTRGPNDPACPTCLGVGYPKQLPPKLRYWIVCQCGGFGWVPRDLLPLTGKDHLE